MKTKDHSRQVREEVLVQFKAGLGSTRSFEHLPELCSTHHLNMERGLTTCRPTRTWTSTSIDRLGKENSNQYKNVKNHELPSFHLMTHKFPVKYSAVCGCTVTKCEKVQGV
ncbi:hypothetical protein XENORESO_015271 [Xenotaenia resolanae]|uniref:Uncharacterized protein n=1 Tax=Xenotaenia resolanae TaxID=208358 RepID=A0ABV0VSI0_9TELE